MKKGQRAKGKGRRHRSTGPSPVPWDPAVTRIQGTALADVHAHEDPVVTVNCCGPPPAVTSTMSGETVARHSVPATCVTATARPATVTVPVRAAASGFGVVPDARVRTAVARLDVAAARGGAAGLDGGHHAPVRDGQRRPGLGTIGLAMAAEHVRHGQRRAIHRPGDQRTVGAGGLGRSGDGAREHIQGARRRKGYRREARSEGSVEHRCASTDKSRIQGASAGRAGDLLRSPYPSRVRRVDPATVHRRRLNLPREICAVSPRRLRPSNGGLTAAQKPAEGQGEDPRDHATGSRRQHRDDDRRTGSVHAGLARLFRLAKRQWR